MNKHVKIAVLATIMVLGLMVPTAIYADTGKTTVNTEVLIVGVIGLEVGAIANTVRGWWNAPQVPDSTGKPTDAPYSYKKLAGSILMASIQAPLAISATAVLATIGDAGLFMAFWLMFSQGMTVDVLHTLSKN